METINKTEKLYYINKWYFNSLTPNICNEYNLYEFFNYAHQFTDEMFDLVLILSHYNFEVNKIFEWSKSGKLGGYLLNANAYINDIKSSNLESYNILINELKDTIKQDSHENKTTKELNIA